MTAFVLFAYMLGAVPTFMYYYIDLLESCSESLRRSIFWPLYTIRWLVSNFLLAILGK